MEHSQNGWTASRSLATRPFVVNGVAFLPGIRDDDDVETVLRHVVEQYAARVEPLKSPGCWGYSYRANRNDPNSLSNHASGTAVDVNAPAHPNGIPTVRTFTLRQRAEVRAILNEVHGAVRWGGDYSGTPDAMHFEINVSPDELRATADALREDQPMNADDKQWMSDLIDAKLKANNTTLVKAIWDAFVDKGTTTARAALRKAMGK